MYKHLAYIFPDPSSGPRDAELDKIDAYLKEKVPSRKISDILSEAHRLLDNSLKEGGKSESFIRSLSTFVALSKINKNNLISDETRKTIEENYRATGKIRGCGCESIRDELYLRGDSRVDKVVGYYVDSFNDNMERSYETGSAEYYCHVQAGQEYKLYYNGPNRWD